jgi:putative transposase
MHYRRAFVPGGTFFFTLGLADRNQCLLTEHIDALRAAFRLVKARHPFEIVAQVVLPDHLHAVSRRRKRERAVWQRRYWEHRIRDEEDLQRHIDYIHFNPVKHGHVSRAADWPYSSIHRYIRNRAIPVDWGGEVCAAGSIHVRWD